MLKTGLRGSRKCFSLFHTETPQHISIKSVICKGLYSEIPHLIEPNTSCPGPDLSPFSFLALLPPSLTVKTIDGILQSLLPLRPREHAYPTYAALLSFALPSPASNPCVPSAFLPLALAIMQTAVRSGFPPPPDTKPALAAMWIHLRCRHHRLPPSRLLSSLRDIGYRLDTNTCGYLIASLCSTSHITEAVDVLKSMRATGCAPESGTYCTVIEALCGDGRPAEAEELLRTMVLRERLAPKRGMPWRILSAFRQVGEARKAVEALRFLEAQGCSVGFDGFEEAVKGCVASGEFVLAGKVLVEMINRGYIARIKTTHKVVEGLATIGQQELAAAVRQKLADITS